MVSKRAAENGGVFQRPAKVRSSARGTSSRARARAPRRLVSPCSNRRRDSDQPLARVTVAGRAREADQDAGLLEGLADRAGLEQAQLVGGRTLHLELEIGRVDRSADERVELGA